MPIQLSLFTLVYRAYPHAFAVPERRVRTIILYFGSEKKLTGHVDGWELQLHGASMKAG